MTETNRQLGHRVILEDEHIRVWEHLVHVGDTENLHTHQNPYLAVVVSGDTAESLDAAGNVTGVFEFEAGETYYFPPEALPVTHQVRNTGFTDLVLVLVEFLSR
jgi:mannose-6-phosphate isomerase-like protein (cupin superfamily)